MNETSGIAVDLHVHSKLSKRPSQWILQKINCPESFTEPAGIYAMARKRGMDLVTISDHNCIEGALEIAHLPGTFISEEITAYFPEDGCKLHVLALDITEAQHEDITRARQNVYELTTYLNENRILHVLAHPLFNLNHLLTLETFEKMLLLFNAFELNGARDERLNQVLKTLLANLSRADIERLADKHNITPVGPTPWVKSITGGSDDHSGLNIGRRYTRAPGAIDKTGLFNAIRQGNAEVCGQPATPKTMAHNLYGIAYQFYKSKFNLGRYQNKNMVVRFADAMLTSAGAEHSILNRLYDFMGSHRSVFSIFKAREAGLMQIIEKETRTIITENRHFQDRINNAATSTADIEDDWFAFVTEATDRIIRHLADTTLDSLAGARLFNIFQTIGSAGSVYSLLAPYFMAYTFYSKDREFASSCLNSFSPEPASTGSDSPRVAIFTDTLHDINGVAMTLRHQLEMAEKNHKSLRLITCGPESRTPGETCFDPIGTYDVPEYSELKVYYPPFLQMLQYCYEQEFTHIHCSTPGPVGLAGLCIARILNLPVCGTYHTAFPQYVAELTGDADMKELVWKFMTWFYNQMTEVFVPSDATGEELAKNGILRDKIRRHPRGVDTRLFHPAQRNGIWSDRFGISTGQWKLLYVGRISREKNLHLLAAAFRHLCRIRKDATLIIVGKGPYEEEMQRELAGLPVVFAGPLYGETLAQAYASSDIFVFPSTTDTFGNVVLEAQASGIPVIVSDRGGPQENLLEGKTGLIVPGNDPLALSITLFDLIEHPDRIQQMKCNARKYMEKRTFESAFLESWDMYTNAATPHSFARAS